MMPDDTANWMEHLAVVNSASAFAGNGVYAICDKQGLWILHGAETLAVYMGSNQAGRTLPEWLGIDDLDAYKHLFERALPGADCIEEALATGRSKTRFRWLSVRVLPLDRLNDSVCSCCLIYIADVTSRVDAIEQVARSQAREIDASARLQAAVLLSDPEIKSGSFDLASATMPSRFVDGDFLDVFQLTEGKIDLILGDVMGKGMEAATLGTLIKFKLFRSLAGLLHNSSALPSVAQICALLEQAVSSHLATQRNIVTMAYGRMHERAQAFEFTDCGHTPIIHVRGTACRMLKGSDMPLGFADKQEFRSFLVPVRPGDVFLLYSDGLSECVSASGEFFGEEKIMYISKGAATEGARVLVNQLVRLGFEFSASGFSDDVSLLCLKSLPRELVVLERATPPMAKTCRHCSVGQGTGAIEGSLRLAMVDVSRALASLRKRLAVVFRKIRCIDETERGLLLIACHEALSNIADHGITAANKSCLAEWRITEGLLSLEFTYQGRDYDWLERPDTTALQYGERGYGLSIIHSVMDSVLLCNGLHDEKTLVLCRRLTCWKP